MRLRNNDQPKSKDIPLIQNLFLRYHFQLKETKKCKR